MPQLPEGFELDQPNNNQSTAVLPEGFVVNEATQPNANPELKGLEKTEQVQAQRPSAFDSLEPTDSGKMLKSFGASDRIASMAKKAQTAFEVTPLGQQFKIGGQLTGMTEAVGRSLESAIASPLIAAQKGVTSPKELGKAVWRGLSQEEKTELGDVYRNLGVSEPISASLGLISAVGLGALAGKGLTAANKLTKPLREGTLKLAGKTFNKPIDWLKQITNKNARIKDPKNVAREVRSSFFEQKRKVGKEFAKGIDDLANQHPDRTVDLSDNFQELKNILDDQENIGLKSDVKALLRRTKDKESASLIDAFIDNPNRAKSMTLKQTQKIKQAVQDIPSISTKLKQGKFANWQSSDIEMLDFLDDIRFKQSEAFPEMQQVRKPYAQFMNKYKVVKNKFKEGSLLRNIRNGFGDEEVMDMVDVILPDDTTKLIKDFNKSEFIKRKTKSIAKRAGAGAGLALGGSAVIKASQAFGD